MTAVGRPPAPPGTLLCPRCGSTLRDDQGWCLECGLAARTRVHPPPSWRVPVLVTCVALLLAAAGIAYALYTLLDKPQSTPPAATVTVPAATPPAATAPTTVATTPTATFPTTVPTTPTAPTTPTTTAPAAPKLTTPSGAGAQKTFTLPGTRFRVRLPANATGGAGAIK